MSRSLTISYHDEDEKHGVAGVIKGANTREIIKAGARICHGLQFSFINSFLREWRQRALSSRNLTHHLIITFINAQVTSRSWTSCSPLAGLAREKEWMISPKRGAVGKVYRALCSHCPLAPRRLRCPAAHPYLARVAQPLRIGFSYCT
jgi:hypothetical protein